MKTLLDGSTKGGEEESKTDRFINPELEPLIELFTQFSRTKLSLQSLLLRPKWRQEMIAQYQAFNLALEDPDLDFHWMPTFYRLSRRLSHEAGGLNMRSVADTIGVPLSTATRLTDTFVSYGLLERQASTNDRRIVLVTLTGKGQAVFNVADLNIRRRLAEILDQFTQEEQKQLLNLGERIFTLWTASLEDMASHANKEATTP